MGVTDKFGYEVADYVSQRQNAIFCRIHQLAKYGLKPSLGVDNFDAITWRDRNDRYFYLYADGKFVASLNHTAIAPGTDDTDRIYCEDADDDRLWEAFIGTLPNPPKPSPVLMLPVRFYHSLEVVGIIALFYAVGAGIVFTLKNLFW